MPSILAAISTLVSSCGSDLGGFVKGPVEPVEFVALNFTPLQHPETLAREQAESDFTQFAYVLRHGYSGFEDAELDASPPLSERLKGIERALKEGPNVLSTAQFESLLAESIKGLKDGHIAISGTATHRALLHKKMFVSRVVFSTKAASENTILEAGRPDIVALPVLRRGERGWILGRLASPEIGIAGRSPDDFAQINLAPRNQGGYVEKTSERIGFVGLRTLDDSSDSRRQALEKFVQSASRLRNKDFVVLDFRENQGGSDAYWLKFLATLYQCDPSRFLSQLVMRDLESPVTGQGYDSLFEQRFGGNFLAKLARMFDSRRHLTAATRNHKFWNTLIPKPPAKPAEERVGGFGGKVILVFNRETASSAESIYRSLGRDRSLLVGENSYGAIGYGNVLTYVLPYSGLTLSIPATKFESSDPTEPYGGDGIGFQPDFWCLDLDWLATTLSDLTGQEAEFFESAL